MRKINQTKLKFLPLNELIYKKKKGPEQMAEWVERPPPILRDRDSDLTSLNPGRVKPMT